MISVVRDWNESYQYDFIHTHTHKWLDIEIYRCTFSYIGTVSGVSI